MRTERRRVATFVTRILTHYRLPFHERVRRGLAEHGVDYRLIHGQPDADEAAKGDLAMLPWAERVTNRPLLGRGKLVWQPVWRAAMRSDLVVLGQENQLLVNYPLQLLPRRFGPRLALFGHGRNFQARDPHAPAERWKRFWATRCDWWFAYTEESRRHVESLGFPPERITVFNNAIDTAGLRSIAASLDHTAVGDARAALGVTGDDVAVFVGGLYPEKRIDFLVAAADLIRAQVPGFQLVVVGAGVDADKLRAHAAERPWLIPAGPRFGRDKVAIMLGAKLFLMPGLVGLAVLDAAALGLPLVTSAYPRHSPEIAYLEDGVNGVIVPAWQDPAAYAAAVTALLRDDEARTRMADAARAVATRYSIDGMAERFVTGVLQAMSAR